MLLEGQQIEHYRILRSLGSGKVYLAKDTRLDKQVAIRVINAETLSCVQGKPVQEYRNLILPELEKIAQLDHPSIMPVYHYGVEITDESFIAYMVLPFCRDSSLIDWLQQRSDDDRLSPQNSAHLIVQVSEALQYAHTRQIVHRHLTPSKLFLHSKLENQETFDLWLTGFEPDNAEQTTSGAPLYIAPEQWMGNVVPATDQYALAVIAYRLLTGVLPFQGNLEQVKDQHLHLQPLPPGKRIAGLSPLLDTVLLKALGKQPDERFASMLAFSSSFTEAAQSNKDCLCSTLVISKGEAQRGTSRLIALPGERHITIVVPAGAYDRQIIHLRGQGTSTDEKGTDEDLFIIISIDEMLSDAPVIVDEGSDTLTSPSGPMEPVEPVEPLHEDISDEPTMREFVSIRSVPAPETPIPSIAPVPGRITAPLPAIDSFDEPTLRNIPPIRARNTTAPASEEGASAGNQEPAIRKTVTTFAQTMRNVFATALAPHIQNATQTPIVMRARKLPGIKNILMLVLACLIIIGAGSLLYNVKVDQQVTTDLQASATAQIRTVSTHFASTAAAQVSATATSSYDPYPPVHGTLVFVDPLHDNKLGHHWQEIASLCGFMNASYEISREDQGVNACTEGDALNDFAYQVQMTITQGDAGGLILRYDGTNNNYYYFSVNTKGSYALSYSQNGTVIPILDPASSAAIKAGPGQTNLLAVVVRGRNIDLYVNNQHLAGITDAAVNSGQIGMAAEDDGNSTEVSFSDVKVWNN